MPKKKKGPDPAALQAELKEVEKLTREHYLSLYRREHSKSAGHRTAHKDKGKVAGFEPQPQPEIAKENLDRLIVRRNYRAAWEDGGDDDAQGYVVNDDPDGVAQQEYIRSVQHDVSEALYHVTSAVDGLQGKAELEVTEDEIDSITEAVDSEHIAESTRVLNEIPHQIFVRSTEPIDMFETIQALYQRKKCGILEELARNLNVSYGRLTVVSMALACKYLPLHPSRTFVELLVMYLYTCDPVHLDKILGFWSGSAPPEGYTAKSPSISTLVTEMLCDRNLKVMGEWICFMAVLASCTAQLPAEKRGRTLYCGVHTASADLATVAKNAKTEDIQYWPCFASCSLDLEISAKQNPSLVFILRGVTHGIDLTHCTQNSDDSEVIISPFSVLRVKAKIDSKKIELEQLGTALEGDLGDIPLIHRKEWGVFMQEVRDTGRREFGEQKILQQYQLATRRSVRHKKTLQQLSQLITQAESEQDALTAAAADKSRAPAGKGVVAPKPEDTQALLDSNKLTVLDSYLAAARKEQTSLERQLTSMNAAITANKEALASKGTDLPATNDLRHLLKLQTEHYNGTFFFCCCVCALSPSLNGEAFVLSNSLFFSLCSSTHLFLKPKILEFISKKSRN